MKNYPVVIVTAVIYALLILIGGLIGFFKAGSNASLLMSSCATVLMLFSIYLIMQKRALGLRFASLITLILLVFFSYRFWLTAAIMPSGMMMVVSLIVLFIFLATNPQSYKVDSDDHPKI